MCKIHDRIKCHSLFLNSTEQNAVLTCVLPSPSNVLLLFPAVKQLIDSKYFFCTRSVKFIPIDQACDGKDDCAGGEDEITCVSSFLVNTTFPGRPDSVPLCQHRHKSKAWKRKKEKKWLLLSSSLRHSSLQCVSRQLGMSCRCTVLAQVGGVCVVKVGPSSTQRRHANNWDTHSEFTPTEDEQIVMQI